MTNQVIEILVKAAEGLLYPSESDYPFEYVEWDTDGKKLTKDLVRKLTGKEATEPVKIISLDKFFNNVTEVKDWYGEEEKAATVRFVQLKETLQNTLQDIQVFRLGEIEISAYVMGKTNDGAYVGLSTKVVET